MYTISSCKRLPGGDIIMIIKSDDKLTIPVNKGIVRANVILGSVILRSVPNDLEKT